MVKRREPPVVSRAKEPTAEEIEAFAAAADGEPERLTTDPKAKRDFKAIRVPFNEYEFEQLEALADKTGRSKLNAIRWAILKMAEEVHK